MTELLRRLVSVTVSCPALVVKSALAARGPSEPDDPVGVTNVTRAALAGFVPRAKARHASSGTIPARHARLAYSLRRRRFSALVRPDPRASTAEGKPGDDIVFIFASPPRANE